MSSDISITAGFSSYSPGVGTGPLFLLHGLDRFVTEPTLHCEDSGMGKISGELGSPSAEQGPPGLLPQGQELF